MSEYSNVFTDVLGKTNVIKHEIKLQSKEPITLKGYPIPFKTKETLDMGIKEILQLGVIGNFIFPYSSTILLIPKTDNSVRLCMDYIKKQSCN